MWPVHGPTLSTANGWNCWDVGISQPTDCCKDDLSVCCAALALKLKLLEIIEQGWVTMMFTPTVRLSKSIMVVVLQNEINSNSTYHMSYHMTHMILCTAKFQAYCTYVYISFYGDLFWMDNFDRNKQNLILCLLDSWLIQIYIHKVSNMFFLFKLCYIPIYCLNFSDLNLVKGRILAKCNALSTLIPTCQPANLLSLSYAIND